MAGTNRIADSRSWVALLLSAACAIALVVRWHKLAWVFGAVVVLLALRALSIVLSARASMSDPEERLQKQRAASGKHTA
jgi:hypothetical protein